MSFPLDKQGPKIENKEGSYCISLVNSICILSSQEYSTYYILICGGAQKW